MNSRRHSNHPMLFVKRFCPGARDKGLKSQDVGHGLPPGPGPGVGGGLRVQDGRMEAIAPPGLLRAGRPETAAVRGGRMALRCVTEGRLAACGGRTTSRNRFCPRCCTVKTRSSVPTQGLVLSATGPHAPAGAARDADSLTRPCRVAVPAARRRLSPPGNAGGPRASSAIPHPSGHCRLCHQAVCRDAAHPGARSCLGLQRRGMTPECVFEFSPIPPQG